MDLIHWEIIDYVELLSEIFMLVPPVSLFIH